jgi:hypothetical protein
VKIKERLKQEITKARRKDIASKQARQKKEKEKNN